MIRPAMPFLVAALLGLSTGAWAQNDPGRASHPYGSSRTVPGQYVVVFKPSVADSAQETARLMRGVQGRVLHVYSHALKGFAATLPDAAVQALRLNPNVESVDPDQTISLNTTQTTGATWGQDRIDQRTLLSGSSYTYNYNFTGLGVTAYIIDTGILSTHQEFGGRVSGGQNFVPDSTGYVNPADTQDCHGHGTHVAGTVAGATYGVAKSAALVPVRVLGCTGSGSTSGVIAGVDWVAANASKPAVANMSLGGGYYSPLNSALAGAVAKGVTVVVAAGNSNADACNSSPSSEPSAITVGASTVSDVRASYSNYGSCVDLFAPGSGVVSAGITSNTATATMSGTSMASPHVAGVAALVLQSNAASNKPTDPGTVTSLIKYAATTNALSATSLGTGSPNLLLYSLADTVPLTNVQVLNLTSAKVLGSRTWTVTVTPTVVNSDNTQITIANAVVSGSFSPGGAVSCKTAANGTCNMSVTLKNTQTSTTFTVNNVTGTGMVYTSAGAKSLKINR